MSARLERLFRPLSIAVIGGGAWGRAILTQCRKMGFSGALWPVHPTAAEIGGVSAFSRIADLPSAPDAAFVAVNREATIEAVAELRRIGTGGAVCFASGFAEADAEDSEGPALQAALVTAAGEMPLLGPNCYGFINALDGALLWPDQHGCQPQARGVAIVTQSSNIAINLTMQRRGLPIAYMVTAGNQAQTGLAAIGEALIADQRVTALGLHIEGIGDLAALESLSRAARLAGKPVVAVKVGRSASARAATVSHTASIAGSESGADALLRRLGIARVDTLPALVETLKLLHLVGPLPAPTLASISCSGGEASLVADMAEGSTLVFPPLNAGQHAGLRAALGPKVALANPLDYHTYIWRDTEAMARAWAALADPAVALILTIVDFPRADRCDPADWECTIEAALAVRARTGAAIAMVSSLPELMPEEVAQRLMAGGVVPLNGLAEALRAAEAAAWLGLQKADQTAVYLPPRPGGPARLIPESAAKARLAGFGLTVPVCGTAETPEAAAEIATRIGFPVALKGEGPAHKSEAGAVRLNLATAEAVRAAAADMAARNIAGRFLVEQMAGDTVAELLVGVVRDPAHGYALTIGAGGTLAELARDSATLLLPAATQDIEAALDSLRIAPVLAGYRGRPGAARAPIIAAIRAIEAYVLASDGRVAEIEVNPLICAPNRAVAADALIREVEE